MERIAEEFVRRRRELVRRGEVGRGKRYSGEMIVLAVRFAAAAEASGWTEREIAERLEVAPATLARWRAVEGSPAGGELREVVVAPESSAPVGAEELVLVTPEGFRIEGLASRELVAVVEALRR